MWQQTEWQMKPKQKNAGKFSKTHIQVSFSLKKRMFIFLFQFVVNRICHYLGLDLKTLLSVINIVKNQESGNIPKKTEPEQCPNNY